MSEEKEHLRLLYKDSFVAIAESVAYGIWSTVKDVSNYLIDSGKPETEDQGKDIIVKIKQYDELDKALCERLIVSETIHALNRRGVIPNYWVDKTVGYSQAYLKYLYYPSITKPTIDKFDQ